ncbi:MAG: galactose mutarotase [Oscillospiraceae bacterium]|nr:galactose mutarotase [Oscillospiraceae bacterium]
MTEQFGTLPGGEQVKLYTISKGGITAKITDYGATLVSLWVPDAKGETADVVLGYDSYEGYEQGDAFFGATVGRNANRIGGASFLLNGQTVTVAANENGNNLHSGPDCYNTRLWRVERHAESGITLCLHSPHLDQGFPGNADIRVTYTVTENALTVSYDAVCDRDTVFNMTNHSYFNLAGQDKQHLAMEQTLMLSARFFNPDDAANIPTGELRPVAGTPMDFGSPKPLGQDIGADYEPLKLQGGYDHNFEVYTNPCAVLCDPHSGRTMQVHTDCPGIQVYTANFTDDIGKGGIRYRPRCAVALETQFYPDSVNHPEWRQPFVKAGQHYRSTTEYRFL